MHTLTEIGWGLPIDKKTPNFHQLLSGDDAKPQKIASIIIKTFRDVYLIKGYTKEWDKIFGNLLKDSLINEDQLDFTYESYIHAIKGIASELGINYYFCNWKPNKEQHYELDGSLRARDLYHFSVKIQHLIFEEFLKIYDMKLINPENTYENLVKTDNNIYKNFTDSKINKTLL